MFRARKLKGKGGDEGHMYTYRGERETQFAYKHKPLKKGILTSPSARDVFIVFVAFVACCTTLGPIIPAQLSPFFAFFSFTYIGMASFPCRVLHRPRGAWCGMISFFDMHIHKASHTGLHRPMHEACKGYFVRRSGVA